MLDNRKLAFSETSDSCAVVMHPQFCMLLPVPGKLVVYALSDKLFIGMWCGGLLGSLLPVKERLWCFSVIRLSSQAYPMVTVHLGYVESKWFEICR